MIDARAFLAALLDAAEADPTLAERLRRVLGGAADDWVPLERAAEIAGVNVRVLKDAARRGRIDIGRGVVRRAELDRYLAAKPTKKRVPEPASETDASSALDRAARRWSR